MLESIAPYVKHFTDVIAGVVGIDTEVVDRRLVRVAGTGVHADRVGVCMASAGELYRHSLEAGEPLFVDNPREHPLCAKCRDRDRCIEQLTMCAPIVLGGEPIGIIGLLCYTLADRGRVLANRDLYINFVTQMADAIARAAKTEQDARDVRRRLDMLLKITDSTNSKCMLVLDSENRVAFINDQARQELGLDGYPSDERVAIIPTGGTYFDMEEYDLSLHPPGGATRPERTYTVVGRRIDLDQRDEFFDRALVFDSKAWLAELLSRIGGASDNGDVLDAIIGESPLMRSLKTQVLRIAATSSTVLITGESGTGKEMFARAIHAASLRGDKPFVAINCGAIPDALLESELFGYVRGAFTDANPRGRMGKFELADGGVLFLDEISAMPLYLQVKLLRVIQERQFHRLGSNKPVRVDLRIIAATNEKLPDLIAQKMFREDLYYRLNVIPFELPPLRDRREDIPGLAEYFLERYCRLFGKPKAKLSPTLLEALRRYQWPGNVREFENCIEYMVNMHDGPTLAASHLPAKILDSAEKSVASDNAANTQDKRPIIPLAELERRAIDNALAYYGHNAEGKRLAAEALGIGIATLYRKIKP
jgi:transcriptional regulator with PAS, ATPase and Fis domain